MTVNHGINLGSGNRVRIHASNFKDYLNQLYQSSNTFVGENKVVIGNTYLSGF